MGFDKEVEKVIESGVEPITMIRSTVRECASGEPVAYRASLQLNSQTMGKLTEAEYGVTAERSKKGILLVIRAITYAKRAIDKYLEEGKKFEFISVVCPDIFLTKTDPVSTLKRIFEDDLSKLRFLCLEFHAQLLFEPSTEPQKMMSKLKDELGVKMLMRDFGGEYCPIMRMENFRFDYVSLDQSATDRLLEGDKRRRKIYGVLMYFVKELGVKAIAADIDSEQAAALSGFGYYGYTSRAESGERLLPEVNK